MLLSLIIAICYQFNANGLKYEIIGDTLNVSIVGTSDNWAKLIELKGKLEIPSSVIDASTGTSYLVHTIGASAFSNCHDLVSIILPDSIISIEHNGFTQCSKLSTIIFSKKLEKIGFYAFYGCNSLVDIKIESKLTALDTVFSECRSLVTVDLQQTSLESLSSNCFNNCYSLKNVILSPLTTTISSYAFQNCIMLTTINLENVIRIREYAFSNCRNLVISKFSKDLAVIEKRAFEECHSLHESDFSSSQLGIIGEYGFLNCISLKKVLLPSFTEISDGIFKGCKSLTQISLSTIITTIPREMFFECHSLTSVIIPISVKIIGDNSFYQARALKTLSFSSNLESVSPTAFVGCDSLESFDVDSKNEKISSINGILVENPDTLIAYPPGKSDKDYTIPDQIQSVYNLAFYSCNNIEILRLNKVISLEQLAIYGCSSLKQIFISQVTIGLQVSTIEECKSLERINVDKTNIYLNDIDGILVQRGVIILCPPNHPNKTIILPNTITSIEIHSFMKCHNIESISFPLSLTSINKEAFMGAISLKSVTIPDSVTYIATAMFKDCISLESIVFGKITRIPSNFLYGSRIKTLSIPKTIQTINDDAFNGMACLQSIVVGNDHEYFSSVNGVLFNKKGDVLIHYPSNHPNKVFTLKSGQSLINNDVFQNAVNLESFTVESGAYSFISFNGILYNAYYQIIQIPQNIQLETIVLSEHASFIGDYVFKGLQKVKRFEMPKKNSFLSIIDGVLYDSYEKKIIFVPPNYSNETIKIGKEITSIQTGAFQLCQNIKKIEVHPENYYFSAFEGVLFDEHLSHMIYYPIKKESEKFMIPISTLTIDSSMHQNSALSSISLETGNDMFSVKDGILYDRVYSTLIRCPPKISLETVTIPASVINIQSNSFQNCVNVKSIYFSSNYISTIGSNLFLGMKSLKCVSIASIAGPYSYSYTQTIESAKIYVMATYPSNKFGVLPVEKINGKINEVCSSSSDGGDAKKPKSKAILLYGGISGGVIVLIIVVYLIVKSRKPSDWKEGEFSKI